MQKNLNYTEQLGKMRKKYSRSPMTSLSADKPSWLIGSDDPMNYIYDNTSTFLADTKINYGCIIQANELLFDKNDKHDCPATFITSDSEYVNNNPELLLYLADDIYAYKHTEIGFVPQHLKSVVESIQDEHDRNRFVNKINFKDGNSASVYIITMMVFRNHLPKSYLTKRIYPLLTNFEKSKTAMILPQKYWTWEIKKNLR